MLLTDIVVTSCAVENKLKALDSHKAMGPDNIPSFILKEFANILSVPLTIIVNKTSSQGRGPSNCRTIKLYL